MTTPTGAAGAVKATADLLAALRSLAGQSPAADSAAQSAPGSEQVLDPGGLLGQARQAKRSYQTTSRWILGAFAAVGLLLFGSLPFSDIGKVHGFDVLLLAVGLGCAAVGIALAIFAASIVAEPLDASLGALEQRLRPAMRDKHDAKRLKRWLRGPRRRSEAQLVEMLTGDEKNAHLGPGIKDIGGLIEKLGTLEKARLELATVAAEHGQSLQDLDAAVSAHLATLVELRQQVADLGKVEDESLKRRLTSELSNRIQRESAAYAVVANRRALMYQSAATPSSSNQAEQLAATECQLETYLGHRAMVLVQSAMMQMRGTFQHARRIMVAGAFLTLGGGALYAYVLPHDASAAPSSADSARRTPAAAAQVTINRGTDIAAQLPDRCVGRSLPALRDADTVPPVNGPFEAVITDLVCPGSVYVPKNQGSITSPALK